LCYLVAPIRCPALHQPKIELRDNASLTIAGCEGRRGSQISDRGERIGVGLDGLYLYSATNVNSILSAMAELQPSVVIIDSIQTVYLEDVNSSAGSVSQVRCTRVLT
jgi:DNA repair protein RadA/Sms